MERAADIEALFAHDSAVSLHVAASFTVGEYLLPERLAQWVQRYPRRPIQMSVDNTHDVVEAVAALQVDIGFVEGPVSHPDVLVRPWLDDELVLVARAGHPLAGAPVELAALRAAAWALREPGSGTRQVAESWLRRRLDALHVALELGSTEAIKRAVLASDLLTALSRYAVQREVDQGTRPSAIATAAIAPASTRPGHSEVVRGAALAAAWGGVWAGAVVGDMVGLLVGPGLLTLIRPLSAERYGGGTKDSRGSQYGHRTATY